MTRTLGIAILLAALPLSAQPRITSVVHGADFSGTLAPGALATIFGTGLATAAESASAVPLPTALRGASVNLNGRAAPLTYVSATQINFQVPAGLPVGPAAVTVSVNGQTSSAFSARIAATAPGIFQYGANRGVVQNQDYSLNSATNLATARSTLIVYLTGIGLTNPAVADGNISPSSPLAIPPVSSSATIAGQSAKVLFLGLTPGNVGLAQANIEVPLLAVTGDFPLVIEVGGIRSASALVSVRGDERVGLPEGAICVSGPVERVVLSREKELQGMADEIVIGETKLCLTCDRKAPLHAPFVKLIDRARKARQTVDACYDEYGTVTFIRLRR